jgi:rfaE bifunctional protein kinase chain/domain
MLQFRAVSARREGVTSRRLLELAESLAGKPILMLVDLVADRFVSGTAKRISREAPVLILQQDDERLLPGGGANAVANVRALGGAPLPVGVVGDDASGRALLRVLGESGVDTSGVLVRSGYTTPTKTRILGGSPQSVRQQIVRIDVGEAQPLSADEEETLAESLRRLAPDTSVAVVSDYGYGAVTPALLPDLRRALAPGAILVGDSRFRLPELTELDGATPNQEEAESWLGTPLAEDETLQAGGARLLARFGGRFLLITRGSRGMALFERREGGTLPADRSTGVSAVFLPVFGTDQVADVTGAGDTVIGSFALALAAGGTPLEAALLATYAAGTVVTKMGTATLTPAELEEGIRRGADLLEDLRWVES